MGTKKCYRIEVVSNLRKGIITYQVSNSVELLIGTLNKLNNIADMSGITSSGEWYESCRVNDKMLIVKRYSLDRHEMLTYSIIENPE